MCTESWKKYQNKEHVIDLLLKSYQKALEACNFKKIVYYGIVYIANINIKDFISKAPNSVDIRNVMAIQEKVDNILRYMQDITYADFINMFPISKDYSSHGNIKVLFKDYYSTKDYFSALELIGVSLDDKIISPVELLNNYTNDAIFLYLAHIMYAWSMSMGLSLSYQPNQFTESDATVVLLDKEEKYQISMVSDTFRIKCLTN